MARFRQWTCQSGRRHTQVSITVIYICIPASVIAEGEGMLATCIAVCRLGEGVRSTLQTLEGDEAL